MGLIGYSAVIKAQKCQFNSCKCVICTATQAVVLARVIDESRLCAHAHQHLSKGVSRSVDLISC